MNINAMNTNTVSGAPAAGARYKLAEFAALLADPARAAMLLALMDGTMRPAGELARMAGVAASTASSHLRKLTEGGVVTLHEQGRHRYYGIANERIADMLEAITLQGERPAPAPIRGADSDVRRARTCYKHLAGRLGVNVFEGFRRNAGLELTDDAVRFTETGQRRLREVGLLGRECELASLPGRPCIDWTERRFHLGGRLGVHLTDRLFQADWLRRRETTRAVFLTTKGRDGLRSLGVDV